MTPEQKAREQIDNKLELSGWVIQDLSGVNPMASLGVAVREYPTSTGPVDYALFVDGKPVGVVEAKKDELGESITVVEQQSGRYANSTFKYITTDYKIRFAYEATGQITRFTDYNDIKCRSRSVFSFHRPETLLSLLSKDDTIRNNLKHFPEFDTSGFRKCQITAIQNLDTSFAENRPKALVQMATGAGKTFTAITAAYRLLKYGKMKRILFLVDTKSLGEQAEREFLAYTPNDDNRSFAQLYGVRRLNSSYIPNDIQICISTIQRMYSILKGEEIDESAEEESLFEQKGADSQAAKEVVYNEKYPPEFFDCIIVDECHRSIYNVWNQVLEYFDSFIIGLTATPDKRTFAFFNQNVVSEYSREQAIIDGVNVGEDIFLIETDITKNGAHIMKQQIEYRDRMTRAKRWKQMDEDLEYTASNMDRDVVNPSQIRTVIRTFKECLPTQLFPHRREVPKTLIFAKTDSHADDIIQIVREEFGEGNDFCQKITCQAERPETVLSAFRNDYYPRIAVTVDMIATGTDVKPIECLIFMRDVRSKNYFEQMKGRGTRTLGKDDLQKVTPSATENKDHFVIVDAVGVTKSKKTETRTLERKPSVSMKELMMNVAMGSKDEDILTSPTTDSSDAQVILSAVMLAALNIFDVNKFKLLVHVYMSTTDKRLRQRALVGWFLVYPSAPKLFEQVDELLAKVTEDDKRCEEILQTQKQFFYCLNAEKVSKDIHDGIIPNLVKDNSIRFTPSCAINQHKGGGVIRKLRPKTFDGLYAINFPIFQDV